MVPVQLLAALALLASGCSEREDSQAPVSATPLVAAPSAPEEEPSAPVTIQTGGMTAKYTVYYRDEQLRKITEQRSTASGAAAQGEYEFHGARLIRYRGAPLEGEGLLTIELDLNGAVVSARRNDAPASDDDVYAIRNRASLLRNHALTQRATSTHAAY